MGQQQAHIIESKPVEERYARGWHCLGLASDFEPGKAVGFDIFGTALVAYRGEDGEVHVLDGYCPHMGWQPEARRCVRATPSAAGFHRWSWGKDGVCDDIPYAKKIPEKACIKVWPSVEKNKLLFVWNDPEGSAPTWEVPAIEECFEEEWTDWAVIDWNIDTNCRELVDNISDMAHFGPVHGAPVRTFRNRFQRPCRRGSLMVGGSDRLAEGGGILTADSAYYGPAYHITRMTGSMAGQDVNSILLNCHTPVDTKSFVLRFGVIVKKIPGLSDEENQQIGQAYVEQSQNAFKEDVQIWDTKTRVDNPLMCDGDGPIHRMRQWYEQFYMDAVDATMFQEMEVYEYQPNQI